MSTKTEKLDLLTTSIGRLQDKDFHIYFYVIDTKGNPNGSLAYIYKLAKKLHDMGYKVGMLHTETDFVGVSRWLGEEYANLPHYNTEMETRKLSVCDYLIVPELFANVMRAIKNEKAPCKRIVLCQNYDFITEFLPAGLTWHDYGFDDVLAPDDQMADRIKRIFPTANVQIIPPAVNPRFDYDGTHKKMQIGILIRDSMEFHKTTAGFYLKYPEYGWVSFAHLYALNQDVFAEKLNECPIVVWSDRGTYRGQMALEAMRSKALILGRVPDVLPEWAVDKDNNLIANVIWYDSMDDLHKYMAYAIESFINSNIPDEMLDAGAQVVAPYTEERQTEALKDFIEEAVTSRINYLTDCYKQLENSNEEND